MVRRSKYEMLDMDLANKAVFEQAKAKFPLGIDEHDVSGKYLVKLNILRPDPRDGVSRGCHCKG